MRKIWNNEPLFCQYKWERFRDNFRAMQNNINQDRSFIAFDIAAFAPEQAKFPRNALTERGYPFWDGHAAQKL